MGRRRDDPPMIFAVVPAAGKSQRMGRPKLTLPLSDCTVLEHVITALRAAGVDTVVVVAAPDASELVQLAEGAGAVALLLSENTIDMRATVEYGLAWLDRRFQPSAHDAWFLVPADHPLLDQAVGRRRVVPASGGVRGHPTLFAWNHAAGIRQFRVGEGLNQYVRRNAANTREVIVGSAAILRDLDTPDDYEVLKAAWEQTKNPSSRPSSDGQVSK